MKCGFNMKSIGDNCELLDEDGSPIDAETDEKVNFHFNALLDAIADWRRHSQEDFSLGGMVNGRYHQAERRDYIIVLLLLLTFCLNLSP